MSIHSNEAFSRGRKFSADELQLLLLALLHEAPRHGYELIKLIEMRSNGFYAPSPGMVYPALTHLGKLAHAGVVNEGNRKRYSVTDAGRAYLATQRTRVAVLWAKLNMFAQHIGMVRRALAGAAAEQSAGTLPLPAVMAARQRLHLALAARLDASPLEQMRIASVLERAAADIEQVAP